MLGWLMAWLVHWLRQHWSETYFMDDFLGLGLIALANGVAQSVSAYAFLAVFAAAVTLRQTEHRLILPKRQGPDRMINDVSTSLSERSLHFNEQLERMSEVLLILLLGGSLFLNSWTYEAVLASLFVFLVARPAAVYLGLWGLNVKSRARRYMAWFGVRGIGSLYYLMYAIQHGLPEPLSLRILSITLIVVILSILVHGITVTPLMRRYVP